MAALNQTKELLSIVSNQKGGVIPGWLAGQFVKVMLTCYLVAVVLGVVFSFFLSRPLRIADVRVLGTARFAEGATKIDNKAN
ncbi:TPA: hypothetical protein ACMDNN_003316 [Vibrio cholerae]